MEDGQEQEDTSASRPEAAATRPEAAATRQEAAATRQDPRVQTLKIVVELLKQEKYLASFFNRCRLICVRREAPLHNSSSVTTIL